jgi:hypothetical protein
MPLPDLIADAACDPRLVRELRTDAATVYRRYALSPGEIAMVEARDKQRISQSISPVAGTQPSNTAMTSNGKGSLLVAGSGITSIAHLTLETVAAVETADVVFYLVIDQLTINWIHKKNANARPLYHHYEPGKNRRASYEAMVEEIMAEVRAGRNVIALFYGHPGVLVFPGHRGVEQARAEGFDARMLPGVSADACMIADLGFDPATDGLQSFEATQFLRTHKAPDTRTPVILWQIGVVGDTFFAPGAYGRSGFDAIIERLSQLYGPDHRFCIYEVSEFSALPPSILWRTFNDVRREDLSPMCTLFIPARASSGSEAGPRSG